jgi:NAD(P)H-dependent FMN reductase
MQPPKLAIIIGSTREGRFADRPAQWIREQVDARGTAAAEILDLRDYPLRFFDEPRSPMWNPPGDEAAVRWGKKLEAFDGFIFVTPEYNHSIPGVLKNALDCAYSQFVRKPAGFVGYGGVGAARAVEQLRLIAVELQIAPLRSAVHVGMTEFVGMLQQGKDFADYPHLEKSAVAMIDDLVWWATALRSAKALAGAPA